MTTGLRGLLSSLGWWSALGTRGPTRLLALNALVDAAGTGLALVSIPFFAIQVAGLSAKQLALVLSVAGVCELVAAVPNGAIAGRVGTRRFMIGARLVEAAAYAGMALANGLPAVLAAAAVAAVGRAGASGLMQALIGSVLGEDQRVSTLGSVRALRNVGYLVSSGLTAVVLSTGSHLALRVCLLTNALSFLLGAVWIARLRPARAVTRRRRTDWSVLRDTQYFGLIVCAAIFSSSLVVLTVGIPLWTLHHRQLPSWSAGVSATVNTFLVIILQFRFASRLKTVPSALGGLGRSAVGFAAMAVLIALTVTVPEAAAIPLLLVAAVALTFGELLESPSWWTLSYELTPPDRKNEYMAAFDLSAAAVGIAGAPAMAAIVALGAPGWLLYGVVLLATAAAGRLLAGRRARRFADAGVAAAPG